MKKIFIILLASVLSFNVIANCPKKLTQQMRENLDVMTNQSTGHWVEVPDIGQVKNIQYGDFKYQYEGNEDLELTTSKPLTQDLMQCEYSYPTEKMVPSKGNDGKRVFKPLYMSLVFAVPAQGLDEEGIKKFKENTEVNNFLDRFNASYADFLNYEEKLVMYLNDIIKNRAIGENIVDSFRQKAPLWKKELNNIVNEILEFSESIKQAPKGNPYQVGAMIPPYPQ
jgi:hypothetical protein